MPGFSVSRPLRSTESIDPLDQPRPNLTKTEMRLAFPELVAITAAVMALNALAIDMMLPALGIIANELNIANANDRQLIVVVYVVGTGFAQLFFGPIVDRFGRRRVLLWALGCYIAASLFSILAPTFSLLLIARGFQGVTTAATRVAILASVRDQVSGRRMAEVMSFAITIFMAAPILAPGFGQLILFAAPWRGIFVALLLYGAVVALWVYMRIPETLPPEKRSALNIQRIASAYWEFLSNRTAFGYTMVSAIAFGALFGLISTSEQIFLETFEIGDYFALAFAAIAAALGVATMVNARLVGRFGMRRLCHGALIVFVVANLLHLGVNAAIGDNLWVFLLFVGIAFFAIGLIGPNCGALAMEPMGHIAGAAAGAYGFAGTTLAGVLGAVIGRFYDGTTTPVLTGFATLGVVAFGVALLTEKGRLFETKDAP